MATALSRPKLISLAAGFTDNSSLPVREVRDSMTDILRTPRTAQPALQYGVTAGDPELRDWTADHLRELDGTALPAFNIRTADKTYSADRVLMTNGSQQLLYMTCEALCNAGDIVLVEDPTYFVFLGILQSHGLHARGVCMTADGLDLEHLDVVLDTLKRRGDLSRVKMLYLVTYFQNPTGITTRFANKTGALKLLKKYERFAGHPIYLLEDAAYRELRFSGEDEPSALAARGSASRVIYAGTYSKPFATGLRVGFGVLPEPLLSAVTRIKGNHDFGTANLLQQTLSRAITTRRYGRHLHDLRRRYTHKADVMRRSLREHLPSQVEWIEPQGGLYFWVRLPRRISAGVKSKVFRAALAANVLYVPGEMCYADDITRCKPANEMRLSFGSASEVDIREGIKRLGGVLQKLL